MKPSEFKSLGPTGRPGDDTRRQEGVANEVALRRRELTELRQEIVQQDVALPAGVATTDVEVRHSLGRVPGNILPAAIDTALVPSSILGFAVRALGDPTCTVALSSNLGAPATILFAFHVMG